MSSSPSRRHSLAVNTEASPSKLPQPTGTPSSPYQTPRSVSSSSALPVLTQGRSFSPSLNRAPIDLGAGGSSGSPFPARIGKVPSREPLANASVGTKDGLSDTEAHVQVVLRIRPSYTAPESDIPQRFQRVVLRPSPADAVHEVTVQQSLEPSRTAGNVGVIKAKSNSFRYDRILAEESTQLEAYELSAKPAVEKFLKGFNVTILAYGQTSSGKSYTMGTTGSDTDYTSDSPRTGIIPRAVKDMFAQLEQERRQGGGSMTWECKVSFLELYNEDLIDLLSTSAHNQTPVTIREDKGKILWSGLREVTVTSIQQVMQLLHEGSRRRQVGETGMNKESSRSHAVFSLSLSQRKRSEGTTRPKNFSRPMSMAGSPYSTSSPRGTPANTRPGSRSSMLPPPANAIRQFSTPSTPGRGSPDDDSAPSGWIEVASKFHFVDLAGSERLKRTAALGERMKEGISINAGLTALGNVISALAEPAHKHAHVPYRDSKLTRLLQDSLGGNSYTIMIACVSPIEYNLNETINTLRYGARARNIKNRAEANQTEVGWDDLVHLQGLVVKLRKELQQLKRIGPDSMPTKQAETELTEQVRSRLLEEQQVSDTLRSRVQEQNIELVRLIKQLQTSKQGGMDLHGTEAMSFSQMVEPIIDEYEKTIANLEAEIERYKAALQISDTVAEEHAEQISLKNKRLEAYETYIRELRTRILQYAEDERELKERVRGLESQVQSTTIIGGDDSQLTRKLKEELDQQREELALNATYLAELERRLETSDDRIEDLAKQVTQLEQEAKVHDKRSSQRQVVDQEQDLVEDRRLQHALEAKDRRLRELQAQLEEATEECTKLAREKEDLSILREGQEGSERTIQNQLDVLSITSDSGRRPKRNGDPVCDPIDPPVTSSPLPGSKKHSDVETEQTDETDLKYFALKEGHARTLAELSTVNARYQEILKELDKHNALLHGTGSTKAHTEMDEQKGKGVTSELATEVTKKTSSKTDEKEKEDRSSAGEPAVRVAQDFQKGRGQSKIHSTASYTTGGQQSSPPVLQSSSWHIKESSPCRPAANALSQECLHVSGHDSSSQAGAAVEDNLRRHNGYGDPSLSTNAGVNIYHVLTPDGTQHPTPGWQQSHARRDSATAMNKAEDRYPPITSHEMVNTPSEATLVEPQRSPPKLGDDHVSREDEIAKMAQQLAQAQAEMQEKIGQMQSVQKNLENSDRNLRKMRSSVQEAYAARDDALVAADSLQSELLRLRSEIASMQDSSAAKSRAMERQLSEERNAKEQIQAQVEMLDAMQKTSKFRCF